MENLRIIFDQRNVGPSPFIMQIQFFRANTFEECPLDKKQVLRFDEKGHFPKKDAYSSHTPWKGVNRQIKTNARTGRSAEVHAVQILK